METVIYSIKHNETIIYVGSTRNYSKRIIDHKSSKKNYPIYNHIRSIGGFDSIKFDIIEYTDTKFRFERERHHIDLNKDTVFNVIFPLRTKKESNKAYRIKNDDKIKKNKNEKLICDVCSCNYTRSNLSQHKKSQKHILAISNNL